MSHRLLFLRVSLQPHPNGHGLSETLRTPRNVLAQILNNVGKRGELYRQVHHFVE